MSNDAQQGQGAEGQTQQQGTQGQQGASTPDYGGFATVEELVAAYKAKTGADDKPKTDADLTVQKKAEGDATVKGVLASAGLNQEDFTKEFAETGDLSEASRAKLEKAGFDRETQDVYLDGLRARRGSYESALYEPAGGKEGYAELLQWAGKALSDAEVDAFNNAIKSGDAGTAKLAVAGLVARKGAGKVTLLNGKTTAAAGVQPYASRAEVRAAVNDPRYRNDPAYRKAHEARLAITEV